MPRGSARCCHRAKRNGALSREPDPASRSSGEQHPGAAACSNGARTACTGDDSGRASSDAGSKRSLRGRVVSVMHWLDVERTREMNPVLECLAFVARQADRPSSPMLLQAGLALGADGKLPFHQIEPALEQVGMRAEPVTRKLRAWPAARCPAILELEEERAAVLLEVRERDGLIHMPGLAEPIWVKLAELESAYTGRAVVVETDPTRERENERPWDEAKRRHWFWSEIWKVRREFWPVLLAALIVNLLAFAMPLFTMNVYDRVIPNKATSTLWVLALGVIFARCCDLALRLA